MSDNLTALYEKSKADWKAAQSQGSGLLGKIEGSIPLWLIIVAAGLFILSAPHTASIFNRLSPWAGLIAPLVIEFGLLFTALRRKYDKTHGVRTSLWFWGLEVLSFLSSIIVNGAGSFLWVADGQGIKDQSIGQVWSQFGQLSAISQVSLILVVFSAFMIPIGTVVAGEGIAALIFERDRGDTELDRKWDAVAYDFFYRAVYQDLLTKGVKPGRAEKDSHSLVGRFLQSTTGQPASTSVNHSRPTPTTSTSDGEVTREEAQRNLAAHPEWLELSDRKLADQLGCTRHMARTLRQSVFSLPPNHPSEVTPNGKVHDDEIQ